MTILAEGKKGLAYAVEFREVARTFGTGAAKGAGVVRAVDRVSLTVEPGEFFAMLGPSGSGKTTCLRLIAGFELPDDGQVLLEGRDVSSVPPYERNVNTVFQDYALFPHLTVRQNVAFGATRGLGNPSRRYDDPRVREWLATFELDTLADRFPEQLSGGQRQRTALARALVAEPRALLLDEPFAALDVPLRNRLREELLALQTRTGLPMILISHDPVDVELFGERVVRLGHGRVVP